MRFPSGSHSVALCLNAIARVDVDASALRMLGVPEKVIAAQINKDEKYSKQDFTRIA